MKRYIAPEVVLFVICYWSPGVFLRLNPRMLSAKRTLPGFSLGVKFLHWRFFRKLIMNLHAAWNTKLAGFEELAFLNFFSVLRKTCLLLDNCPIIASSLTGKGIHGTFWGGRMFYVVIGVWVIWMNSFVTIVHLIFMRSNISEFHLKNYRNII